MTSPPNPLPQQPSPGGSWEFEGNAAPLLQELQARQAELERQNEELRRIQAELDAERAHFFDFYNLAPVGYFTINEAGVILEANLTASHLLGVPRGSLVGQPVAGLILLEHQDLYYRHLEHLHQAREPQAFELRLVRKHGPAFWARLETTVAQHRSGEQVCRVVLTDITGRKEAEAILQESEERYRDLFTRANEGILLVAPSGELLEMNEAFARMHGYTVEEMRAMGLEDLDTPESLAGVPGRMRRLLAGETLTFEVEHRHKDGHVFPLEVSASAISSRGKAHILCFHRDITTRRRLEEERHQLEGQLLQTQKMESLGSLAGGVAHDMNNALAAILASAEVQLESSGPNNPARPALETIVKACLRARTLVTGLLVFARKGVTEHHALNLNDLVQEEVALLERTTLAKVQFHLDLEPGLRAIRGDSGALSHVLMNLCVNAIDAMEDLPTPRLLTLRTRNAGVRVELDVEDTGRGMSGEVKDKALEPFFTTKPQGKGTGLGLSIAYGTMKSHSGELELRSEPGQGTCVCLRFPAAAPATPFLEPDPLPHSDARTAALHILLVDDDELVRQSLGEMLELLGHSVIVATSGEEALATLNGGLEPGVVILDLNMPGLGGEATLALLRDLRPDLPVLLATGRVEESVLNLVQTHAHVSILPKPFGLGEIRWHLEQLA